MKTLQMSWPTNNWPWLADGVGTYSGDCAPSPDVPQAIGVPLIVNEDMVAGEHCQENDPLPAQNTFGFVNHRIELDKPTMARVMPEKIKRWSGFSATNQVKARLNQTDFKNGSS